ncbi:MAG: T9SS type A sorting domain-containing protein [Bacteroidota bacterium]
MIPLRDTILFFICMIFYTIASGQCPEGDLILRNQFAIDKFLSEYPDCEHIKGNLFIVNYQTSETGKLKINLSALDKVRTVDNGISIQNFDLGENELLLPNLKELNGNIRILDVSLADDAVLFPQLEEINESLSLNNFQSSAFKIGIKNINGHLILNEMNRITDLSMLNDVNHISEMVIQDCAQLNSIQALQNFQLSLESLQVTGNPELNQCNIPAICDLLILDDANLMIKDNGIQCSDLCTIKENCEGSTCSCPIGLIEIRSVEELIAYKTRYYGCETLDGSLTITNFAIPDSLFDTFESLKTITADLSLQSISIVDMGMFSNLEQLQKIEINSCAALQNLHGLENLNHLEEFYINACNSLESISTINFTDNLELKNLDIRNCPLLDFSENDFSLSDLHRLSIVNLEIKSLAAFSALQNVEDFSLLRCNSIESIIFEDHFTPKKLSIYANENLNFVSALNPSIKELEYVFLNTIREECNVLKNVERITHSLSIAPGIATEVLFLDLSSINYINEYTINGIKESHLPGFNSLDSIQVLHIANCENVEDLNQLSNLSQIDTLILFRNDKLTDISALNSELGIKQLIIDGNGITDCAIEMICERTPELDVIVQWNEAGCESLEEIDAFCQNTGTILAGDFVFDSQSKVDSFFIQHPTINTIYGNVTIDGSNPENTDLINDLSPLSNLSAIEGSLDLYKLRGPLLHQVNTIKCNSITIVNREVPLSVPLFENIDSLESLRIVFTDSIIGDVIFPNLNHCETIEMTSIEYWSGSLALPQLKSTYSIKNTSSALHYIYLDDLEEAHTLEATLCPNFEGFRNCQNLSKLHTLSLRRNNAMVQIFDTTSLASVNEVLIKKNDHFSSLKGFENLIDIQIFHISECNAIVEISLPSLSYGNFKDTPFTQNVFIGNNASLESIHLPRLRTVDKIYIVNNDQLTSLDGLDSLTLLTYLYIQENELLESLNGLNDSLAVLDLIEITDNPNLNICGHTLICRHLERSKPVVAQNNHMDCLYQSDLYLSCNLSPLPCPFGDVILTNNDDVENYITYYNSCKEIDGDFSITGSNITLGATFDSLEIIEGNFNIEEIDHSIDINFPNLNRVFYSIILLNNTSNFNLNANNVIRLGNSIRIENNTELVSVANFKVNATFDEINAIWVKDNTNLSDLRFLDAADGINILNIINNSNLTSLADLNKNSLIYKIDARNNPILSTCNVPAICNNLQSGYLESYTFHNNVDSCETDIVYNSCLGITNLEDLVIDQITLFPNPTHHIINIRSANPIVSLSLYNTVGELVFSQLHTNKVDLRNLNAAFYFLTVKTAAYSQTFKILKL